MSKDIISIRRLRSKVNKALLNFAKEAAESAVDIVDVYSFFLNYQRAIMRHDVAYAKDLKLVHDRRELQRRLRELQRQRFITARRIGKKIEFKITKQGNLALYINQLKNIKDAGPIKTLVIFDIPETERGVRRQIRLLLRQAGFKKVQQSVWARHVDVYDRVEELVKYLKASKWITVIRTNDQINH